MVGIGNACGVRMELGPCWNLLGGSLGQRWKSYWCDIDEQPNIHTTKLDDLNELSFVASTTFLTFLKFD
jgi:hypothetical protein